MKNTECDMCGISIDKYPGPVSIDTTTWVYKLANNKITVGVLIGDWDGIVLDDVDLCQGCVLEILKECVAKMTQERL